ncbi:unnamed protein product [Mytilus coruscus]|uniref:Uncharacterized protein n=1 Tax=Mytilus coruscus TaxID=42192 RepID=A0A6J8B8I0_MYTCO|nr:unnamed protein product [Mytilus coruscus]
MNIQTKCHVVNTKSSTGNVSTALYQYLCQNIVGTEEHVKTIRMMNTVRDNYQSTKKEKMITSGSFGEGLEMRGSDIDVMLVRNDVEVSEDTPIYLNAAKVHFTMDMENTKSGYTKLRLHHYKYKKIFKLCNEIGNDFFLSNLSFKQAFSSKMLSTVHGPCVSDKDEKLDVAYCLHSKLWITPAKQWVIRSNNSWPKYDVKQFWRYLLLDYVMFAGTSRLIPTELEMEVHCVLPPVVYAHFLGFLCHYHLQNSWQYRDSLRGLQLTIQENSRIPGDNMKSKCYNILGICFQLLGDMESARQAFKQSVELFPDEKNNTAFQRLVIITMNVNIVRLIFHIRLTFSRIFSISNPSLNSCISNSMFT